MSLQSAGATPAADPGVRRLVIVGASLAGVRAAESARRSGFRGAITMIGQEVHPPYDRPPLSKEFLTGPKDAVFYHSPDVLRHEMEIDLVLGQPATALDPSARAVMVGGTREIGYDRLIVATGATPRRPRNLPDINGVVVLRALGDALALRAAATAGARVLVVGGGLIGSELASSLSTLGATATIVEAAPVPLVRAFGTTVATRLSQLHERHGTELLRGVEVVEVEVVVDPDGAARVSAARLSNGRRLDVDLVVAGIGATPATRWLAGSGLALNPRDGAVVCDGYLRSSDPAVYAAGDVAEWPGGPAGTRTRLENWSNAGEQGVVAGRNAVTGHAPTAYETVPYFWSDWYGHRIQFVGSPLGDDVRFYRTAGPRYGFVALYREGGRLAGAAAVNGQKMMMKYRRLIRDGASYEEGVALFAGELAEDPGGSGDLALARPGGATAPAALNEQPGLLRGEDGT